MLRTLTRISRSSQVGAAFAKNMNGRAFQLGAHEKLRRQHSGDFPRDGRSSELAYPAAVDRRGEYFYNFGVEKFELATPPPAMMMDSVVIGAGDDSELMHL